MDNVEDEADTSGDTAKKGLKAEDDMRQTHRGNMADNRDAADKFWRRVRRRTHIKMQLKWIYLGGPPRRDRFWQPFLAFKMGT